MAIRVRRGSDADRLTVILEEGEVAFTTDTQMFYVGDNATLGGILIGPGAVVPTSWGTITGVLSNQLDLQAALNAKEPTIVAGLITDYYRGDKTFQPFPSIPVVTPAALTRVNDTNVTLTLGGTPTLALLQAASLTLGWTGTLADARITSSATWNAKQDAITLTTLGTSGVATFIANTLNIPNYADTGITTLNTLVALTQTFAVGTSGTDFAINSAISTHTFNLPTASALNRGALNSTDWTTFNSKQGAITLTTVGTTGASTFIANTLNIPSYVDQFVGTVTSVGLTAPSAFTITGSPITTSGTLAITGAGLVSQYIDGTGALQAFPALSSGTVTNIATAGLISGGAITTTGTITTLMATNRLVGRGTALSGVMEEIILGTNLSLTGTTLNAVNSGGTVTAVTATTPILSTGGTTPVISMPAATTLVNGYLTSTDWTTFNNKGNGTVLSVTAAPGDPMIVDNTNPANPVISSGILVQGVTATSLITSSGGVTPNISTSMTTNRLVGRGTALSGVMEEIILGTNLSLTGTTLNASGGGGGTVTSVAATVPTFLSVSGSPITTSGTLAVTLSGTALPVLNGGTGVTTSTGSGNTVLSTSPTLVTPILGSASATALTFSSTAVSGSTINKLTTAQRQALTPVIGDVVYDTTIGTTCTYTGTFWQYSKEYYVTSFATTTTTLASAITGLTTFILEANSTYAISGAFLIGCSNTGGVKFGNSLPVGAASYINYMGTSTSTTVYLQSPSTNGTLTATAFNRFNSASHLTFGGLITTIATAGSVDMQFASGTAAQTSTIYGLFSSGYQSKITLTKIA